MCIIGLQILNIEKTRTEISVIIYIGFMANIFRYIPDIFRYFRYLTDISDSRFEPTEKLCREDAFYAKREALNHVCAQDIYI